MTGTFFTTRYTRADEEETLLFELDGSAVRVRKVRVASIDNDVTFLEVRNELSDEIIDSRASLDEEDHFPGSLEERDELFDRVSTDDGFA